MRVSDADRHSVVDVLARHAGDGYLDVQELEQRSARAFAAKTRADLSGLLADLPAPHDSDNPAIQWAGAVREGSPARAIDRAQAPDDKALTPERKRTRMQRLYRRCSELITVGALLTGIWLMSGGGYYWPMWVLVPLGVFTIL